MTIVPDELLKMCKSNKLIASSTEGNDRADKSTLLNMALGVNAVHATVNQDFLL